MLVLWLALSCVVEPDDEFSGGGSDTIIDDGGTGRDSDADTDADSDTDTDGDTDRR